MFEGFRLNDPFEQVHSSNPNDFVCLIKSDHRRLEDLMRRAATFKTKENAARFAEHLADELLAHLKAEEELLFPIVETKAQQRAQRASEENTILSQHVDELRRADTAIKLQARFQILRAIFKHHMKEIELKLLPLLNNGDADPIELGHSFLNHKKQFKENSAA